MNQQALRNISNIAVVGGGNIGTQFACVCASRGYSVRIYSSKPDAFSNVLEIVDSENRVNHTGKIDFVTDNLERALHNADLVFVTLPAFMFPDIGRKMERYISPGMCIGVIPGTGGAEFAFRGCIERGAVLFGLQRVPGVARLTEYGKRVCVEGLRDKLHLAAIPNQHAAELSTFVSELFDMPCENLPNYLCVTMTPSNPILHTTRLCAMFQDYQDGTVYPQNPLFYGEWSEESSELLFACDTEHQQLCAMLNKLDLTSVRSLKDHYESDTPEKLTKKIRSIASLHNLLSPMKKVDGGWIPDFSSRYFTADFPYGLAIIQEIARLAGAPVSNINKTLQWYYRLTGQKGTFKLSDYGVESVEDLYKLYQ